jgi:hypothetical protein
LAKYDQGGGCSCGLNKICECEPAEKEERNYKNSKMFVPMFANGVTNVGYKNESNSNVIIIGAEPTASTILLHSGNYFDFLDPDNSKYTIEDIAHGLSMACRYAGQCREFYSVAEHSYWVSYLVPSELAYEGLMHDSSEAFTGDMNKPLKNLLHDFETIEKRIEESIAKRFKFKFPYPPEIKVADRQMLVTEQYQNMNKSHWKKTDIEPANIKLGLWSPKKAKHMFLKRYYELQEEPL